MQVIVKEFKLDKYQLPVMNISLKERDIISIPTQIGCAINCDFCISKTSKFVRNLTDSELNKLVEFSLSRKSMISFTGEGEPILNIHNINKSISYFNSNPDVESFRICMSGLKSENISLLNCDIKPIDLQISLHSPFDDIRKTLIQHTKDINYIFESVKLNEYKFRNISINYVLMDNINDRYEDLYKLISICDKNWTIKLNPLLDEGYYKQSSKTDLFFDELTSNGFKVKKFRHVGSTIKNGLYDQLTYSK